MHDFLYLAVFSGDFTTHYPRLPGSGTDVYGNFSPHEQQCRLSRFMSWILIGVVFRQHNLSEVGQCFTEGQNICFGWTLKKNNLKLIMDLQISTRKGRNKNSCHAMYSLMDTIV